MLADIRYAFRLFRKAPAFVFAAVTTLGFGIGANVAIFSLIDRIVLRPLDVRNPAHLIVLQHQYPSSPIPSSDFLYDEYLRSRSATSTMSAVGGFGGQRSVRVAWPAGTVMTPALFVSANYFDLLGVPAHRGRLFLSSDDTVSADPVGVLSERAWRTRLNADPQSIGRTIRVGGLSVVIVGVTSRGFAGTELGGEPPEVFFPLESARQLITAPDNLFSSVTVGGYSPTTWVNIIGRLRVGATREQASAEFASILKSRDRLVVTALEQAAVPVRSRDDVVRFSALLASAVMLTLFIACANLTSLLFARVEDRKTELAVRAALGAGRGRLLRQLLVEATVIAACGGIAAVVVASWIGSALAAFRLPGGIIVSGLRDAFDGRLLIFTIIMTASAAMICGLGPAVGATYRDVVADLKRQGGAVSAKLTATRTLLAIQVALSLVLLTAAGLFVRTVSLALAVDVGFDARDLIVVNAGMATSDSARAVEYKSALFERAKRIPGVQEATLGPAGLAAGHSSTPEIRIDGVGTRLSAAGATGTDANGHAFTEFVGPDYFSTLRQPLVRGRDFSPADAESLAPVAIVSESLARRFWPAESPIGHRIGFLPLNDDLEIVGVARDVKQASFRDAGRLSIYVPLALAPLSEQAGANIVLRAPEMSETVVRTLYRSAAELDPDQPLVRVTSVRERIQVMLMPQRLGRALLSSLSSLALIVTIVGIYGLIAGVVARSEREIGIRIALGADHPDILKRVTIAAVTPVAIGIGGGAAAAMWASRFADRFMYGIRGNDPGTLTAASLSLLVVATIAVVIPARRALSVDPVEVLRSE